mmetsp:Transcript_1441/g.4248  ORF Transcript_1441/g.4248 Transcript_1441/m.4248 type:complete len:296 (+) Transcript_1441:385-1272(+)
MPRDACSSAEKRRAKLAGMRPVRMPACHAAARRPSASVGKRLNVTYCVSLQCSSSLGKFSCGILESQTSRPPRGTTTFTRRSCISSPNGTGKGTVFLLSRGTEPSGCSWAQCENSLWKPGTVTQPPEVGTPSERQSRPCTAKNPGEVQGFWSQCSQLRLVLQSGRSVRPPPSAGLPSLPFIFTFVGLITPNRSTETTRRPSGLSSLSPSKRSWRQSEWKTRATAGLTRFHHDSTSEHGSNGSKKFLQPAGQASSSQVRGSPRRSRGWPPRRLGLSQSSLIVASTCASLITPRTTT